MTINIQTLVCQYDPNADAQWSPNPIACEPVSCQYSAPNAPDLTIKNIIYSPNTTTNKQYQTTISYVCPSNLTLPNIISTNFSLDYSLSNGFIYNVTAYCEVDGWVSKNMHSNAEQILFEVVLCAVCENVPKIKI